MSHSTSSLLLTISISSHLFWVQCHTPPAPALYVFGDSTVDSGNNNHLDTKAKADIPPYGIDFDGKPNGRFTNGRTAADFIAQLTGLPFPPPYKGLSEAEKKNTTTGVNYASGSCGILPETGKDSGTCLFFDKQIDLFESTVKDSLKSQFNSSERLTQHLSTALFYVDIGSNDYLNNYIPSLRSREHQSPQAFAQYLSEQLVKRLLPFEQRLYELGARKFLVANIGPLGCLPNFFLESHLTKKCFEPSNTLVSVYNSLLTAKLLELSSTLAGSTFVHLDAYKFTLDVVKNPQEFGISNVANPCFSVIHPEAKPMCQNQNQHFYFDGVHPTQPIHFNLAKRCFEDSSICTPINLKKLLCSST